MTTRSKNFRLPVMLAGAAMLGAIAGPPLAGATASVLSKIHGSDIAKHSIAGNRLKKNTLTGAQIKESTLGTVPIAAAVKPLHWIPLTLKNDWTIFDEAPAVALSSEGIVYFRGQLFGGTDGAVAFKVPKAMWPASFAKIPVDEFNGDTGQLTISSDSGDATIADDPSFEVDEPSTEYTSLTGASYSLG